MGDSINVITTNELIDFLKQKLQDGLLSFSGDLVKISLSEDELEDVVSFEGALIQYYHFKIPPAEIGSTYEQEYYYRASEYEAAHSNETQLISIYNNFNQDNIIEKAEILNFKEPTTPNAGNYVSIISPNQSQNDAEWLVSEYSGSFPRNVIIETPAVEDTPLYDLLQAEKMFESFADSLSTTSFLETEIETESGTVSVGMATFDDVCSNMALDPLEWQSEVYSVSDLEGISPLTWATFKSDHQDHIGDNYSFDFKEFLLYDGSNEYHDTICYEITKSKSGSEVQTFFIPPEQREFYDTQIFSNTDYDYTMYAYVLIINIGIKFQVFTTGNEAAIKPSTDFLPSIAKIPILSANITTQSYAPTSPEVTFINQSDEKNKFRIFLEQSFADHMAVFQPLVESDLETDKYTFKGENDDSLKMKFKISEAGVTYEIYKLNQKPTSYLDFNNSLAISSTTNSNNSVVDMMLTPNRKFYFVFRVVDSFNIPSNPSPVYEVELIKDSDETRITHKIINFEQKLDRSFVSFGRFLKIYPAFDQLNINYLDSENSGENNNTDGSNIFFPSHGPLSVGDAEVPIWERKMKFRIRSKNTGKVIDININFTINNIQTEEEFNT